MRDYGCFCIATTREEKNECVKQWERMRQVAFDIRDSYDNEVEKYGIIQHKTPIKVEDLKFHLKLVESKPTKPSEFSVQIPDTSFYDTDFESTEFVNHACRDLLRIRPLLNWLWGSPNCSVLLV